MITTKCLECTVKCNQAFYQDLKKTFSPLEAMGTKGMSNKTITEITGVDFSKYGIKSVIMADINFFDKKNTLKFCCINYDGNIKGFFAEMFHDTQIKMKNVFPFN